MKTEPGPDGLMRCWWCLRAPEYIAYHDEEWGRPIRDDRALFEAMTLEAFQSGLSWLTILRKREGFRAAFSDFEVERIAAYGPAQVDRLLGDVGIVRHRGKIEATIANARATVELASAGTSLAKLVWGFAPTARAAPTAGSELASVTPESKALSRELKRRGFRFVGPTTAYSLMQAAGLVNDHLADCAFRHPTAPVAARGPHA